MTLSLQKTFFLILLALALVVTSIGVARGGASQMLYLKYSTPSAHPSLAYDPCEPGC